MDPAVLEFMPFEPIAVQRSSGANFRGDLLNTLSHYLGAGLVSEATSQESS
jgi:hypothetical protein